MTVTTEEAPFTLYHCDSCNTWSPKPTKEAKVVSVRNILVFFRFKFVLRRDFCEVCCEQAKKVDERPTSGDTKIKPARSKVGFTPERAS